MKVFARICLWFCAIAFVIFVIFSFVAYFYAKNFLSSERFFDYLQTNISKTLRADAKFQGLTWNDGEIFVESFAAKNFQNQIIGDLTAQGVSSSADFASLRRGYWSLKDSKLGRLNLSLNLGAKDKLRESESTGVELDAFWLRLLKKYSLNFLPKELKFDHIDCEEFNLEIFRIVTDSDKMEKKLLLKLNKANLRIEPLPADLKGVRFFIEGGEVKIERERKLPILRVLKAEAVLREKNFELISSKLVDKSGAELSINIFAPFAKSKSTTLKITHSGVKTDEVIPPDWLKNLDGNLSGIARAKFTENAFELDGELSAPGFILEALPILEQIARYTRMDRFRKLKFHQANANYRRLEDAWEIEKIVLESLELMRVEGDLKIGDNRSLQGNLKVGVVPGALTWLPGSANNVFVDRRSDSYLWTDVKLTGTLDNIENDLTMRIRNAILTMPLHLIDSLGYKVLDQGTRIILDGGTEFVKTPLAKVGDVASFIWRRNGDKNAIKKDKDSEKNNIFQNDEKSLLKSGGNLLEAGASGIKKGGGALLQGAGDTIKGILGGKAEQNGEDNIKK